MTSDGLNEREFEIINIIGAEFAPSQRDLSRHMDLSLGMTNMLIRRLIAKGYIRIRQLNKRKVQYMLTPKGFAEKMQKSVKYTLKTISSIGLIRHQVKKLIFELYEKGERHFFILGSSDLVALVKMAFQECTLEDYTVSSIKHMPDHDIDGIIFICTEEFEDSLFNKNNRIDLIHELAKNHDFVNNK